MNMVLHNVIDFKIEYGDTLSNPKLVEGGKLRTYDRVLANFPFSMDWDNKIAARDPYKVITMADLGYDERTNSIYIK